MIGSPLASAETPAPLVVSPAASRQPTPEQRAPRGVPTPRRPSLAGGPCCRRSWQRRPMARLGLCLPTTRQTGRTCADSQFGSDEYTPGPCRYFRSECTRGRIDHGDHRRRLLCQWHRRSPGRVGGHHPLVRRGRDRDHRRPAKDHEQPNGADGCDRGSRRRTRRIRRRPGHRLGPTWRMRSRIVGSMDGRLAGGGTRSDSRSQTATFGSACSNNSADTAPYSRLSSRATQAMKTTSGSTGSPRTRRWIPRMETT